MSSLPLFLLDVDLSKRLESLIAKKISQSKLRNRINLLDYWGASIYVYKGVSTLESIVKALNTIEPKGEFDAMLQPFEMMIELQRQNAGGNSQYLGLERCD